MKTPEKDYEYEGWKIVDTDDPEYLLMCGTAVKGSCQRVDGDPDLNKCLLVPFLIFSLIKILRQK